MLRLLAMPPLDVFGVGDDDQTIYDHAGADPRFLVDFGGFFPRCRGDRAGGQLPLPGGDRSRRRAGCSPTTRSGSRRRSGPGLRPTPSRPRCGSVTSPPDAGASALVELVGELAGGARRRAARGRGAGAGQLAAAGAAGGAAGRRRARSPRCVRADVLERTGIAAALAWLRVALEPEALMPADLETISRRPSRGFPRWISKWLAQLPQSRRPARDRRPGSTTSASRARSTRSPTTSSWLAGLAADGADDPRRCWSWSATGSGSAGRWTCSTARRATEAAASHLDDLEALIQVADLHPDPAGFEPWLRAVARVDPRPTARGDAVDGPPGQGARVGPRRGLRRNGGAAPAPAQRGLRRPSGASCTSRSPAPATAARCSATPSARRRSSTSCAASAEEASAKPSHEVAVKAAGAASGGEGGSERAALCRGRARPSAALRAWRAERSRARRRARLRRALQPPARGHRRRDAGGRRASCCACDGIGPTKLERYGDEILAVLDSVSVDRR